MSTVPEREGPFWSLARTFGITTAEDFKHKTGYDLPDDEHRAMAVLSAWGYPNDPRYDDIRRELEEMEGRDNEAFAISPEIDAAISHALNTWYGYGAVHGNLNRKPAREAQFNLRQAIAAALEAERGRDDDIQAAISLIVSPSVARSTMRTDSPAVTT